MVAELGMGETATIEANLKPFLLVLCVSLSVATLPNIFGWFRRIPYTLLLVIVGLVLALVNVRLVNLSPGLILTIFLPPLLFEAAWNLKWSNLKQEFLPVSLFAIIGVIISIAGIAFGLTQFAGLYLTTALLIGVCLSATDPVSVVALFRELGVGKQLLTLMEGESLFNDGMSVVAFSFILGFSLGTTELSVQPILLDLFKVVGVGVAVGALIGFSISYLTQRFDLPLVEQSLTLVSAYGTYLVAEDLGGSGVIGVVTIGLILGNFGSRIGMNPRTRVIVTEFWDFLAFFVNSIVFLLIGDQIHFEFLEQNLPTIAITVLAMLLMRAISIYTLSLFSNRFSATPIPLAGQTLLWWGGLRGSVSIALALSVPVVLQERETVIATVFGTVLFTLLFQGLLIRPLLQMLNLLGDEPLRQQFSEVVARQVALKRVEQYLEEIDYRPGVEPDFYGYQKALVRGEISRLGEEIDKLQDQYPSLRDFATEQLRNELLAIEANTYAEFVQTGRLNQELASLLEEVIEE